MAGIKFTVNNSAELAASVSTWRTMLYVKAATNVRDLVRALRISFDGTSPAAAGVQLALVELSSDGTMNSVTPQKKDSNAGETLQATAAEYKPAGGAEPTINRYIWGPIHVHPQGTFPYEFGPGEEFHVTGTNRRIGLAVNADAAVNVLCGLDCEE